MRNARNDSSGGGLRPACDCLSPVCLLVETMPGQQRKQRRRAALLPWSQRTYSFAPVAATAGSAAKCVCFEKSFAQRSTL